MIGEFEKIVEEKGVWIEPCKHRFTAFNTDVSFSFVIMTLCLSGTARALYDQREMTHRKNDLALLLPGHVMRPLECSEDYTYARIAISRAMIERLRPQLFSHDYMKYGTSPVFYRGALGAGDDPPEPHPPGADGGGVRVHQLLPQGAGPALAAGQQRRHLQPLLRPRCGALPRVQGDTVLRLAAGPPSEIPQPRRTYGHQRRHARAMDRSLCRGASEAADRRQSRALPQRDCLRTRLLRTYLFLPLFQTRYRAYSE